MMVEKLETCNRDTGNVIKEIAIGEVDKEECERNSATEAREDRERKVFRP